MATVELNWQELPPPECQSGAVAVGNFDGVHRGHLGLLKELRARAAAVGGPAVVVTFDPHPLQLLRPAQFQPLITTVADRAALLQQHGADDVIILQTTPDLLALSPQDFFEQVLQRRLVARALVEGPNFRFGRNREGTVDTLAALCREARMTLTIVSPVQWRDGIVSSSRVRGALLRGDVAEAANLLARPYRLRGIVGTGQQRGRQLGFPTANLEQIASLIPGDGVYAVLVQRETASWPGAANVGANPTFGEQERKVEVHLIGFQGQFVGQSLTVEFIQRLRDTQRFASPAELIQQLQRDIAAAQQILETSSAKEQIDGSTD